MRRILNNATQYTISSIIEQNIFREVTTAQNLMKNIIIDQQSASINTYIHNHTNNCTSLPTYLLTMRKRRSKSQRKLIDQRQLLDFICS